MADLGLIIHKGDFATVFTATMKTSAGVVIDISGATTKQILFRKPDATILTKTATFTTDGTDGKLTYTTISTDVDSVGIWSVQPKTFAAGNQLSGQKHVFEVLSILA